MEPFSSSAMSPHRVRCPVQAEPGEMAKWRDLGVPPMEIIQSATLWPARFLRAEDRIGVLAPGRYADLILVRGDPLSDMTVMRDVRVVVQGGKRIR